MLDDEIPKRPPAVDERTRQTAALGFHRRPVTGEECLVVIYGNPLGHKYELNKPAVTLGREPDNDVVIEADSTSRRHARIENLNDQLYLVDLCSTNGTFLNDEPITRERLANGDLIRVGNHIFKFLAGDNIESAYHEEIYRMAVTDGLTKIPNRRVLMESLEQEFSRARQYSRNLSCIMLDIDHFKRVNDQFGHLAGDAVLRELAQLIRFLIRKEELFARFGGEEFAILLPEREPDSVLDLAEAIRGMVERHAFEFEGREVPVQISLGVAHLTEEMAVPDDLIRVADQNLFRAKNSGRNRVCS
jgi:diguanylate cyclase (GGDEF)-like protein